MRAQTNLPRQATAASCRDRGIEMAKETRTHERLAKVTELCLVLPAATRKDKGDHASFSVGKKIFAYYLNDHHGDGVVSICCKALAGDNVRLIEVNPRKFYMPAYIGPRGWGGLRLDRPTVDWREVKELVQGSYAQVAPRNCFDCCNPANWGYKRGTGARG